MARKRGSEENIARRKLYLLQEILKRGTVRFDELIPMYDRQFGISDVRTIKRDVQQLQSIGIPIDVTDTEISIIPTGIQALWEDTDVGGRLRKEMGSKKRLAKKTVSFIEERKNDINTLMIGTGSSAYECTKEVLARKEDLRVTNIYTTSLLVLHAFAFYRHAQIRLEMIAGTLDYQTASLVGPEGVKYLSKRPVDAVITSFWGLSKRGFSTLYVYEIEEKRMNLCPHEECGYVIIPMEWCKIGLEALLVQQHPEETQSTLVLPQGERRHVIVTDHPQGELQGKDKERAEILKFWEEKGVEVLRTSRAEDNK